MKIFEAASSQHCFPRPRRAQAGHGGHPFQDSIGCRRGSKSLGKVNTCESNCFLTSHERRKGRACEKSSRSQQCARLSHAEPEEPPPSLGVAALKLRRALLCDRGSRQLRIEDCKAVQRSSKAAIQVTQDEVGDESKRIEDIQREWTVLLGIRDLFDLRTKNFSLEKK